MIVPVPQTEHQRPSYCGHCLWLSGRPLHSRLSSVPVRFARPVLGSPRKPAAVIAQTVGLELPSDIHPSSSSAVRVCRQGCRFKSVGRIRNGHYQKQASVKVSGVSPADNAHYINLRGDPTGSRAILIPGRCGRPSVSSDLALARRPHRSPEALSEVCAREASVSGLAGSASDSGRAAQARAPTSEQRPSGAVLRLCPSAT